MLIIRRVFLILKYLKNIVVRFRIEFGMTGGGILLFWKNATRICSQLTLFTGYVSSWTLCFFVRTCYKEWFRIWIQYMMWDSESSSEWRGGGYSSILEKCHTDLFTANAVHWFDVSSNMRSVIFFVHFYWLVQSVENSIEKVYIININSLEKVYSMLKNSLEKVS